MAFWIERTEPVSRFRGDEDKGGAVSYGADSLSDIATLPTCNGHNQGSSVLVLEDGSFHKLGTIPSRGINGWIRI